MRAYLLPLILLSTFFSCSNQKSAKLKPEQLLPVDATLIINASQVSQLKSNLTNNSFLKSLSKEPFYKYFQKKLELLPEVSAEGEVYLALSKDNKDSLQLTFISPYSSDFTKNSSLKNFSTETVNSGKVSYKKIKLNNNIFYSSHRDSILVVSTNQNYIEQISQSAPKTKNPLTNYIKPAETEDGISLFINNKKQPFINNLFIEPAIKNKDFTNEFSLHVELAQDQILLNGICKSSDSTQSLINIFKNTTPQENKLQEITPSNSDGFLSFTFNNFKVFYSQLQQFNKKNTVALNTTLFDNINEVGVIYEGDNQAIVLHSLDPYTSKDALLDQQEVADNYREVNILKFTKPTLFSDTFSPIITSSNQEFYCIIDDFFVFSNSMETLQNVIASYQNQTTLANKSYYTDIQPQLSSAVSLMQILSPESLKSIVNKNTNEPIQSEFGKQSLSALQFTYDQEFAHVNGIIKKSKIKAAENSITEELNIELDSDILNNPKFVKNHVTGQKEIVVQDVKNNLYLISNNGNILWKKQLNGAILGNVEQIDMYKNGKLQLAFATPNHVYVIDRNGKDVSPFPIKFNDKITQPLSVFDYDNNRSYRLVITQSKELIMLDGVGKRVDGFKFKGTSDPINHQPQHFRIGSKDYIVVKTNKSLQILNRRGEVRIKPKNNYSYSDQAVYYYKNRFTTTTNNGKLVTIDTKGNTASQNLGFSERHGLMTTSKSLTAQYDNKLMIKGKTLDMDFGVYTAPEIFYIYDKIYVSVTDKQAHKVYLFDSKAQTIPNFPIYGNAAIELDNIDNDRNLEIVTKGGSNSLLLYQIN